MEIRALRQADERSNFRCGDPDLDRFLARFAAQNQFRHFVGVTYVAVDGGLILGYATVAPAHMEIAGLPAAERTRLPHYPLPVLRLARLAVDQSSQGQGIGGQLLRFVLGLALDMAAGYGCVGVLVDAKAGAEGFYRKYGFIELEALEGQSAARPQPTPMFLGIRAIRAAARASP